MPDGSLTNSPIIAAYREHTPGSAALAEEARTQFPSGLTHDARRILPYGIYVERAEGSHKWDVDGHEYVDYYGGHGALILGHGRKEVVEAVQAQMLNGTHFGTCHALEVEWARLVKELVPSAETVRFTSSGTEADLMALRLARAYTGKRKVIRFAGHFHGWSDHLTFGADSHFDGEASPGVLDSIAEQMVLLEQNDIESVRRTIDEDGDIAAIILEPTGASGGQVPIDRNFVAELRAVTEAHGIILIFDEVVTGFRVSPGGAQAEFGVVPDLTSLAKILAGGLPGGAICGRKDILEHLDFDAAQAKGFEKISHHGTYNANPLSAAAGIAALTILRDSDACARANAAAKSLAEGMTDVIVEEGLPWACYNNFSNFYLFLNPDGLSVNARQFDPAEHGYRTLKAKSPIATKLRLGLLINGVDMNGKIGGSLSAVHSEEDITHTVDAFRSAINMLREEALLPAK